MGSGGSQTLWPPSNGVGVFGLIDALSFLDERIRLEDPPIADSFSGLSLMVGFYKREQSY